jgi:hypothetical protein
VAVLHRQVARRTLKPPDWVLLRPAADSVLAPAGARSSPPWRPCCCVTVNLPPGTGSPDLAVHRAEIDQARGMLTVQLGVSVTEALSASGLTLTVRTGGSPT